jgi:hypothetical protein
MKLVLESYLKYAAAYRDDLQAEYNKATKAARQVKTYSLAAIKSKEKCTDEWSSKIIIIASNLYTHIKDRRST